MDFVAPLHSPPSQGILYACGENKGGVPGNGSKVLGMSKQFKERQEALRKRPMKWFPSPALPSGQQKGGSDFKIGQVQCTDGASFAREVCPVEGELSVEALTKMIKRVEEMINNVGGDRFEGNIGLLEVRRKPDLNLKCHPPGTTPNPSSSAPLVA